MAEYAIKYVKGDAIEHAARKGGILIHVVNDIGKMASGFVVPLTIRYPEVLTSYQDWFHQRKLHLGKVQCAYTDKSISIFNMIAQHGIKGPENPHPLDYDALRRCLTIVARAASGPWRSPTIHAPRFGAGRSGGSWEKIEGIIRETLVAHGLNVVIYDLPDPKDDTPIMVGGKGFTRKAYYCMGELVTLFRESVLQEAIGRAEDSGSSDVHTEHVLDAAAKVISNMGT